LRRRWSRARISGMLLTYCRNEAGEEQLFLLPKATLEAWLRPVGEAGAWVYESHQADTDITPDFQHSKAEPVREMLLDQLAALVGVGRDRLSDVPFRDLAKFAVPPPMARRQRAPASRRKAIAKGWVQTYPPGAESGRSI